MSYSETLDPSQNTVKANKATDSQVLQYYRSRLAQFTEEHLKLEKTSDRLSLLRLFTAIVFIISLFYLQNNFAVAVAVMVFSLASFIALMLYHSATLRKIKLALTLKKINNEEIQYLEKRELPFYEGLVFLQPAHPYAADLDIFGKDSLYQHINRTGTYAGRKKLAQYLLTLLKPDMILANQKALYELAQMGDWRQDLLAQATLSGDNKQSYDSLITWSGAKPTAPARLLTALSFVMPAITLSSLLLYFFDVHRYFLLSTAALFITNLTIIMTQYVRIKRELAESGNVQGSLRQYSLMIGAIEKENFQSEQINSLKANFRFRDSHVSAQVSEFSSLLESLGTFNKSIGAIILNGFLLRHIHVMRQLYKWRTVNASHIPVWLDVIGHFEALNSMANFAFNNPGFIFPQLNAENRIMFQDLGHPLISEKSRVTNSVEFSEGQFIILTGSNMSGKSTFLRTLGVNMVLAGIGSVVCATSASVHPLPVYVAMRINDSLSGGDSYFLAELKRLKQIMNALTREKGFVLLDEILRGTNSEDKRTGTVAIIEKLADKGVIGVIATHDVEVCRIVENRPQSLSNMCFEAETINNDLSFDYKLREGICKNKSASFLLKKLEVI